MAGTIVRRLLVAVVQLLVTSFVVFSLLFLAPGSPEATLGGGHLTEQQREAFRQEHHLNESLPAQYLHWLGGVVKGDFGESIASHEAVSSMISGRAVLTIELAAYAFVLIVIFGLGLGIAAAVRRGRAVDHFASGVALVGSALSPYVSGILLLVLFSITLNWFPLFGSGSGVTDRLYHLTLPAIAMAISLTALVARTTRTSLVSVLGLEHIEVARSRGLSERRVIIRHGLRNALIPVLTIAGLTFGFLIGGTVLVEYTFSLGGLGSLLVDSVQGKDFPVVQAITLIFAATFIFANLIVDLLYLVVDPRVRHFKAVRT